MTLCTVAAALLAATGGQVRLVDEATWPEEARADVTAALAALPRPLVEDVPGGDLPLRYVPAPLPFAHSEHTPPVVHGCGVVTEHHALLRTGRMTAAQRCSLWRRRAVVHAVMKRWDEHRGWSQTERWRRISGWTGLRNTFEGAYSRKLGMRSPHLDLLTFAEEALIAPEHLAARATGADDRTRCRERSKWRFLFETLAAEGLADPEWVEARTSACPAFDAWAQPSSLKDVEVLFVAASGRAPESLFGHLLLRLVRASADEVQGPSFGTAVQLVALTGSEPPTPRYLWRGITGGYSMAVLTAPTGDLFHEVLEHEQRSIRRFRLKLSAAERARFLDRVWELERHGYFEYWFFTDNCATLLAFLVQGALDENRTVQLPSGISPVLPSAVLDALARAGVLEPVPGTFESVRDRALRAEAERAGAAEKLRALLDASERTRFDRALVRLKDPRLAVRRTGWMRLSTLCSELLPGASSALREAVFTLWATTVRIERYEVERADAERRELLLDSIDPAVAKLPDADATVAARRREFEREDPLLRRLAVLDRMSYSEGVLAQAKRRPLTGAEQAQLSRAAALAQGFRALTDLQADLVTRHYAGGTGARWLGEEERRRTTDEGAWIARALTSSGYARLAVGVAIDRQEGSLLTLRSAALDERLGDQRAHGFRASSETRVLAGALLVRPRWGLPEVIESDLTLMGYRTVQAELPSFRRGPWDALGWGAQLGWTRDGRRVERDVVTLQVDALATVDATPRFERFGAVGVGAALHTGWSGAAPAFRGGPVVSWLQRLPLGRDLANALRLELAYAPEYRFSAARWAHKVSGAASVDVRIKASGYAALLLRPRLSGHIEPAAGGGAPASQLRFELLVEPLR